MTEVLPAVNWDSEPVAALAAFFIVSIMACRDSGCFCA